MPAFLDSKQAANVCFKAGQFEQAEQLYTLAISEAESDGGDEAARIAEICYTNRAAARLKLGAYAGALQDALAAVAIDGKSVKALFRAAHSLVALKRLDEAQKLVDTLTAIEPTNREVKELQATVHRAVALEALTASRDAPAVSRGSKFSPCISEGHREPWSGAWLPQQLRKGHIYQDSPDGHNENLLIMLHGLGDTPKPFAALAKRMALPATATLCLPGPCEVPETDGGRAWFSAFDEETWELIQARPDEKRRTESLEKTYQLLHSMLLTLTQHGWPWDRIHLFGFSQGGTTALELHRRCVCSHRLGGCISVSGLFLEEQDIEHQFQGSEWPPVPDNPMGPDGKPIMRSCCGPVLLTMGEKDSTISRTHWSRTLDWFSTHAHTMQSFVVPGKGHSMVATPDEMLIIMTSFSKTLAAPPVAAAAAAATAAAAMAAGTGVNGLDIPCNGLNGYGTNAKEGSLSSAHRLHDLYEMKRPVREGV